MAPRGLRCPGLTPQNAHVQLHYEKKKGDLNGVDAVWINDQYRLFFYSSPDESGIIVNELIFEISKHYE